MVEGPDRPEEGVLTPEDLDVSEREDVRQLDDNRFFVSLDSDSMPEFERPADPEDDASDDASDDMASRLSAVPETYGVALAAKTESGVEEHVVASNSVVATFEDVLVWYAAQVGDADTPPEDVLRILLEESSLDV